MDYSQSTPQGNTSANWWQDEKLIEELKSREKDMQSDKDPGILWSDAKEQILQKIDTKF